MLVYTDSLRLMIRSD